MYFPQEASPTPCSICETRPIIVLFHRGFQLSGSEVHATSSSVHNTKWDLKFYNSTTLPSYKIIKKEYRKRRIIGLISRRKQEDIGWTSFYIEVLHAWAKLLPLHPHPTITQPNLIFNFKKFNSVNDNFLIWKHFLLINFFNKE
jgi:hypothetical protein